MRSLSEYNGYAQAGGESVMAQRVRLAWQTRRQWYLQLGGDGLRDSCQILQ